MYIKLSFSQDKNFQDLARIVDDLINWTTTTSITALMTRVQTVYGANIADGLTTSTSDLIRTVSPSPTLTKSHFYASNLATGSYKWTLEQSSYDASNTKYYVQIQQTLLSAGVGVCCIVGNAITGGTMASSAVGINVAARPSSGGGVNLSIAGSTYGSASGAFALGTTTSGQTNIRHLWMYINDRCIVMAWVNTTSYSNGWPTTFSDSTSFCGPFIFGQYTRFDYWNRDSNGIIPLAFSDTGRAIGLGFGRAEDYTSNSNYYYAATQPTSMPLLIFNTINAFPSPTSSWPMVYNAVPIIQWGYRDTSYGAPITTANSADTYVRIAYGKGISNTAAERWPSADLSGTSFQLIALGWTLDRYGNSGGNISDRSGIWLFNGDYQPGDEFALGGKTWAVWPIWAGYDNRIGIAIPKE